MLTRFFAFLLSFATVKKGLWRKWYDYLAGYQQVTEWTCMNYGYAGLPKAETTEIPSGLESERWCLQLYYHVASGAELAGKQALEVGSGRGGGAAFLKQSLGIANYTGVDYSDKAVALCRDRYASIHGLTFQQGDAEKLPCADTTFDAVINVESSHCYPDFPKFVSEVHRVLKPGGHFLYADFRDAVELGNWRTQLRNSGLEIVRETNITPNVLAALDRDDTRKQTLIQKLIPKWLLKPFQDFAGTKGSLVYRNFATGKMQYYSFVLRKK
ncbi:MAG TPA: class I SAM-dependent methyltransferase [Verrucomicrobiae bacterium]